MKRLTTYLVMAVLVALSSCKAPEVTPPTLGGPLLSFGTPSEAQQIAECGRGGAGSTTIVAGNINDHKIAVFGRYETGDHIFENHPETLYYSASFTDAKGDTHTNQWVYGDTSLYNCGTDDEPRRPWNRLMDHEFRAFVPFSPDGSDKANGLPPENIQSMSNATKLVLDYYTQTNKFDLMVARTLRNPAKDAEGVSKVSLEFQHVLSALQFKVIHKGGAGEVLTDAYIDGIAASGVLYYGVRLAGDTPTTIHWTPSYPSNNNYEWKGSRTIGMTEATAAVAFDGQGVVFAIPQTIAENQTSFVIKTESGGDATHRAFLPAMTFVPGKLYVFTMTLEGASLNVNVSIKEWTNTQSNVDIYVQ